MLGVIVFSLFFVVVYYFFLNLVGDLFDFVDLNCFYMLMFWFIVGVFFVVLFLWWGFGIVVGVYVVYDFLIYFG